MVEVLRMPPPFMMATSTSRPMSSKRLYRASAAKSPVLVSCLAHQTGGAVGGVVGEHVGGGADDLAQLSVDLADPASSMAFTSGSGVTSARSSPVSSSVVMAPSAEMVIWPRASR